MIRYAMVAAVLAMSVLALYGRALRAPFIFDDNSAILSNKSILSLWPLVGTPTDPGPLNPAPQLPTAGRPLVNLSFAINYQFGGFKPVGYHAVNVVIHFLSAMVIWAIIRRTLLLPYFAGRYSSSAGWLALAAAMFWALHPLQTEAVIYATQRTELMMALFYLTTLYCSMRYWSANANRFQRAAWLALAVVACLAGVASKEVMVSAPLVVLLFERTFISGSVLQSLRKSWPLHIGLASTWILLFALNWQNPRGATAGFGLGMPVNVWWFTQAKVLLMYLKLVVWPWPLIIHYQLPYLYTFAEAWKYVVPVVLMGTLILVLLFYNHSLGFVGACVLAILSPTLVVPIISEMAAERRMYLPLAALSVAILVGAYAIAQRVLGGQPGRFGFNRPIVAVGSLAILITVILSVVSINRLADYADELKLWQEVLRYEPENHVAHQNVGFFLDKAGYVPDAIAQYREAVRLSPDSAQAHYSLGLLLIKTGNATEAVSDLKKASRIMPSDASMRNNLAVALFMSGRNDEAIAAFRATLDLDPNRWKARDNLGLALQKAGRHQEALECFEQALRTNPKALDIYNEVANTYALMNQREKAIATLEHALELARSTGDRESAETFEARLNANR